MGDYFKPWRRKIGILTLIVACVCVAGWVRSNFSRDVIAWEPGGYAIGIVSVDDMLGIGAGIFQEPFKWERPILESTEFNPYANEEAVEDIRLSIAGIRFGVSKEPPPATEVMYIVDIPYPFAAIPLTLICAWLLLSKPRKAESEPQRSGSSTQMAPVPDSS